MSVRKRGEKWTARQYLGAGRWEWLGTFDTRREAKDAKARAELQRKRCRTEETCDRFARRWIHDYPRPRNSTNKTNAENIRSFAKDFAGVRLSDVDRLAARAWAIAHPTYARYARALFEDARNDGLVQDNPFSNLRLPQSRGRRDLIALTEAQVGRLGEIAAATHDIDYAPMARAIVLWLAYVGTRPGELQALRYECLDIVAGEAQVWVSRAGNEITETKTYRRRTAVIFPPALEALAAVPRDPRAEYVFRSITGRPLSQGSLFYVWDPIRKAAQVEGLPVDDLYELRHAAATMLLERGASSDEVAVQLGCSAREVERTYGHPREEGVRDRLRRVWGQNVAEIKPVSDAKEMRG